MRGARQSIGYGIFGSERSESEIDSEIDDSPTNMRIHLRGPSDTYEISKSHSISVSPDPEDHQLFDSSKLDEIEQIFELHASGHSGHFVSRDDFVKCMEAIVPSMPNEEVETIFGQYDKEKKGIIHWKPIIEELREVQIESGSNVDASLLDFFAGKLPEENIGSLDISTMMEHMLSADPMVQVVYAWYRDEGLPAIERVNELERTLENERADRAKVEKELRLQLEQTVKKQEMTMRHCTALERDLEAQIEKHKMELQQQRNRTKNFENSSDQKERDRRDRYTHIIQEKDKELKKISVENLDLTKAQHALREELEAITSQKIDAETNYRLAEDKLVLMERRYEELQEHTKKQQKASKEREGKLREQIKELSAYYARRSSVYMNRDTPEFESPLSGPLVIKITKDKNWQANNLQKQIKKNESIDSIQHPDSPNSIQRKLPAEPDPMKHHIRPETSRRAMSVQLENQKLPKLDVKNRQHWELAKQRRRSVANLLTIQSAFQNLHNGRIDRAQESASPEPGIRISNEEDVMKYKRQVKEAEDAVQGLKERLRNALREKDGWEKKYNSLEQDFKENLGEMAARKQDSRIERVMESIYSDLNRRRDQNILETLQTFQRELRLRNNELTKLQEENAQLRGSQAGDSTSFNVKLWSDQIKEMQEKLIYAESENIKASTDYRVLKEEKENLMNQLKESHFQNELLQKQLVETKTRQPVYNPSLIPFHHAHVPSRDRLREEIPQKAMSTYSELTIPDEIFSKRIPERPKKKSRSAKYVGDRTRIKPRPGFFLRRLSWTDLEEEYTRKFSTPATPPPFFDESSS